MNIKRLLPNTKSPKFVVLLYVVIFAVLLVQAARGVGQYLSLIHI